MKYELVKSAARNVLQDNAVVTFLENHRIQLDNVVVVQPDMRLRLSAQLNRSSATNTRVNEPTNGCTNELRDSR